MHLGGVWSGRYLAWPLDCFVGMDLTATASARSDHARALRAPHQTARVERGAGDGLVVYVCLDPVHGKHRLYAWLRQRYSARQQAAIFGRLVDVDLLA